MEEDTILITSSMSRIDLSLREGSASSRRTHCPDTDARIWLLTERDRTVTTFLLPEEY